MKATIHDEDLLIQVDGSIKSLPKHVLKSRSEDDMVVVFVEEEGDVPSTGHEAAAAPTEAAYRNVSMKIRLKGMRV